MKSYSLLLILSLTLPAWLPLHANASQISSSFSKAKQKLYKLVYQNQGETFYVNCSWQKKKVDLTSCNLQNSFSTKESKRAKRTEAEHVIPASWLYKKNGKFRQCYLDAKAQRTSARKHCQRNDEEYRSAHNDLVNLRPAVGAINAARSNKPFAEKLSGKRETTYRGNRKNITISSRVVIPDVKIRGDVARIALYMQRTYGATYSKRQKELFSKWNLEDPVSNQEVDLAKKINQLQNTDFLSQ
jgi:deoxyribonuclease-1